MFIEWSEKLEIGDPVVDSEHRYLAQLINNLHEQFGDGQKGGNLAEVFTHLVNYVRVHFRNEEALMETISFPEIVEHKIKHKELMTQAMDLSDLYMEGEENITAETLDFLKKWVIEHIVGTDMKIKEFLKGERPPSLTTTPAFSAQSGSDFKICTLCGKNWKTFDDLKNDKDKVIKGIQPDLKNHLYNLILFNCSCGTTLAMFIKEFVTHSDIFFEIEEHDGTRGCPEYCLKAGTGSCLEKCACKYTKQIIEALG